MPSKGGRIVNPADGHSTAIEASLAPPTEVAKMAPADWALSLQSDELIELIELIELGVAAVASL